MSSHLSTKQRNRLYQEWFQKSDEAASHREALFAFQVQTGMSEEARLERRRALHDAAVTAFKDSLEHGSVPEPAF